MFRQSAAILVTVALLGTGAVAVPAAASITCADVVIIGARGTSQPFESGTSGMGPDAFEAAEALRDELEADNQTVELRGVSYPAAVAEFVGTTNSRPVLQSYEGSANVGGDAVSEELEQIEAECPPGTEALLVGYSQGADVMSRAIDKMLGQDQEEELARIGGVLLLGDPAFNPLDLSSAAGNHESNRGGLWPRSQDWSEDLDVPVVSYCRAADFFCQGQKLVSYDQPANANRELGWALDFAPVEQSAALYDGVQSLCELGPCNWLDSVYRDRLLREHTHYSRNGNAQEAATLLLREMGVVDPTHGSYERVDVALIIDSNAQMTEEVEELQSRAEEIVDLVLRNVRGSRMAVIDFKGGELSASNPYRVNVGTDLTVDRQVILDAIAAIEPGGGRVGSLGQPIGVGLSAEAAADNLAWQDGVQRVSVNLWGSRICDARFCSSEDDTGFSWTKPDSSSEWKTIRGGVNLLPDPDGFYWGSFSNTGWHSAVEFPYWTEDPTSDPFWAIESFVNRLRDNLTTYMNRSIAGPHVTVDGSGAGVFDVNRLVPFTPGSVPIVRWGHEWVDDGVDTRPPTRPFDLVGRPADWGTEPPPTMGTVFRPTMSEPGRHNVAYVATVDGQIYEGNLVTTVQPRPNSGPRSPGFFKRVTEDSETVFWTGSEGATHYEIRDAAGDIITQIIPQPEVQADGRILYSYTAFTGSAPDESSAQEQQRNGTQSVGGLTVAAANPAGSTAGIPMVDVPSAVYHDGTSAGLENSGATLTFSQIASDDLEQAVPGVSLGEPSVSGTYSARLMSRSLTEVEVGMSDSSAILTEEEDDTLSLALNIETLTTSDGALLKDVMRDGFADELLFGGSVELQINGIPVRLAINPTAQVLDLTDYVISTDPAPTPQGEVTTASSPAETIELTYSAAPGAALLPLFTGTSTGLNVFGPTSVTEIRTYIDGLEVSNTFSVEVQARRGTRSAQVVLMGDPADGSSAVWRAFLTQGTMSFRVNGGATNVLGVSVPQEDAEALASDPPPELVGATAIVFKLGVSRSWAPVVNWRSEEPGYVYLDGQLPAGLSLDWQTNQITGAASESGVWPVTVYATSLYGEQAMRTFTITVPDPPQSLG